jgi:hypothetical protein
VDCAKTRSAEKMSQLQQVQKGHVSAALDVNLVIALRLSACSLAGAMSFKCKKEGSPPENVGDDISSTGSVISPRFSER